MAQVSAGDQDGAGADAEEAHEDQGARKPDELVAVAEIESGRKATASMSPSEMIERAIASSPSLIPGIRRTVAILTR